MKYRKLRIAWSVASLFTCILLILFYVRSYTWLDDISYTNSSGTAILVQSNSGSLNFAQVPHWMYRPGWMRRTLGHAPRPAQFGFWFSYPDVRLYFPFWFLAPAAAILAAIPWAHQSRWRFSMRTILILTTVAAAVIGGIVTFNRAMVTADHAAIKAAYMAARITPQQAREYTDEDVDSWRAPKSDSPIPLHAQ